MNSANSRHVRAGNFCTLQLEYFADECSRVTEIFHVARSCRFQGAIVNFAAYAQKNNSRIFAAYDGSWSEISRFPLVSRRVEITGENQVINKDARYLGASAVTLAKLPLLQRQTRARLLQDAPRRSRSFVPARPENPTRRFSKQSRWKDQVFVTEPQ